MIKALACDIDGTITDGKRRIDLRATKLLRSLEDMGIPIVLATGNILCLTEAASIYIGTTGPIIAENGGIVKDPNSSSPFYFCDISEGEIKEAYDHLSSILPVKKVRRSDLRKTEIAIHRNVDPADVRFALEDFNVRVVDTKFAIHITDKNVNKGAALCKAGEIIGVEKDEFAAIGDSENDIEMIQMAGLGISIGEELLRDSADFVTSERLGHGGVDALNFVIKRIKEERG